MSYVTLFFLTEAGKSAVSLALKAPLAWTSHVSSVSQPHRAAPLRTVAQLDSRQSESVPGSSSGQAHGDPESSAELGKESRKWVSLPTK